MKFVVISVAFAHGNVFAIKHQPTKMICKLPIIIITHNYPLIQELNCVC